MTTRMADPDPDPTEARRRRLLFRATHRGTHEADLLIGGYVAARVGAMTTEQMDALEELMEWQDVDLANWLTGRLPVPPMMDTPLLRVMMQAAQKEASRR
jgi:antitoxin CptB